MGYDKYSIGIGNYLAMTIKYYVFIRWFKSYGFMTLFLFNATTNVDSNFVLQQDQKDEA